MAQTVDAVIQIMKDLSSQAPVLFHRDCYLYVVSEEGFGQVRTGVLAMNVETLTSVIGSKIPKDKFNALTNYGTRCPTLHDILEQFPDSGIVENALIKGGRERKFKQGHAKHFEAIVHDWDHTCFTLEQLAATATALRALGDDGKIRFITHGTSYHSHKHGYAADGTDVFVGNALVMDRGLYLKLVRDADARIRERMCAIGTQQSQRDSFSEDIIYNQESTPQQGLVMTPYALLHFPTGGGLQTCSNERIPDSWDPQKDLTDPLLTDCHIETYDRDPFKVTVALNAQSSRGSPDELKQWGAQTVDRISRELSAFTGEGINIAQAYCAELNKVHNEVFVERIKWKENLRADRKGKKGAKAEATK